MSYILDALKKSDQQRQHGAAPTLASVQFSVPETRQRKFFWVAGVAAALFVVGILVGWWRPWQPIAPQTPTQPGMPAEEAVARPRLPGGAPPSLPVAASVSPAPNTRGTEPAQLQNRQPHYAPEPPAEPFAGSAQKNLPAANPMATTAADDSKAEKPKSAVAARKEMAAPAPQKAVDAEPKLAVTDLKVLSKTDLPGSVQQELPKMTVSLHAYSSKPQNRLVSVNDQLLHEGDSLSPGLVLEQITPEDMVFSYRGFRFRQELR